MTRALILKMREVDPDRTLESIAQAVGCNERSVRRILQAHTTDVKATTRALMQSAVIDRLNDWAYAARKSARKGYHQPSKDWLVAAEVTEPKPVTAIAVDARPTIVVNMPFTLGGILPREPAPPAAIDVTPSAPALPPATPPPDTSHDT